MSEPRTAAGRALLAEADFHDPSCPRWSDVGNPDAPCSCSLPVCVSAIEQEAASELAEAAGYGLAFMADPEGLAHKRDEWRGLLRNALGPAIEAQARPAALCDGCEECRLECICNPLTGIHGTAPNAEEPIDLAEWNEAWVEAARPAVASEGLRAALEAEEARVADPKQFSPEGQIYRMAVQETVRNIRAALASDAGSVGALDGWGVPIKLLEQWLYYGSMDGADMAGLEDKTRAYLDEYHRLARLAAYDAERQGES